MQEKDQKQSTSCEEIKIIEVSEEDIKKTLKTVQDWLKEEKHYEAPYLSEQDMLIIEMALQKEVSLKPVYVKRKYSEFYICPGCSMEDSYQRVHKPEEITPGTRFVRCRSCGQILDWEGV